MQANVIPLSQATEPSDDDFYREELIATIPPERIIASNSEGIRRCVDDTGLGAQRCADLLQRWLRDGTITPARVDRWKRGKGTPTLLQARALYLLAGSAMGGISAHLSRLVAIAAPLLFALSAYQVTDYLT